MSLLLDLLGKPFELATRSLHWAVRRFRPDHRTINGSSHFPYVAHGSLPRAHVLVQLAPARRRRPIAAHEELVRRGRELARMVSAGTLPAEPRHLDGQSVAFQEVVSDGWEHVDRALTLWATGHVEVFWPAGERPAPAGAYELPIADLLVPIHRLAKLVESGMYWKLLTGLPPRRILSQRVDWRVTVAWTAQAAQSNLRNWTGLSFPAAQPLQRAQAQGVSFSASPIAGAAMWNLRQSKDPGDLLRAVTDELLRWCGYYGNAEAVVDETVRAIEAQHEHT